LVVVQANIDAAQTAMTNALSDLSDAEAAAGALTEVDYTVATRGDLTTALALAETTLTEITTKTTTINDAIAALVFAGQADLDTATTAAGLLTESDYTVATRGDLTTALALAETTNAEVVTKTTAINDAIAALVFA